jgi:tRNA pseudouridine55 synthase
MERFLYYMVAQGYNSCQLIMPSISGLLNVNKPAGMTSRAAVDLVQRLARPEKAGHAGTLDPLATGVLIVCVGQATRLIEYVQRMPKRYTGTFLLGRHSPTEDTDGEVALVTDPPLPAREDLDVAARQFVGRSLQRPPAYSALKVAGRRAYDLARRGEAVALQPRPIDVYSLAVTRYEYPELVLDVQCGGGTYIRSLGRDLAESLGTSAVMSALIRTAIGPWQVADAIDPRGLTAADWRSRLEPQRKAVEDLPALELADDEIARLRQGLSIAVAGPDRESETAAIDCRGRLVAILVRRGPRQWGPAKNFD